MVGIERLNFAYKKESPIFIDFNWEITSGDRWSIIGPSGCGKTTLLYLLAGLLLPGVGKINLNGYQQSKNTTLTGLILQDYGLLPWGTARENVSLGLRIRGLDKKKIAEITHRWLSELGIENVADHYPAELSGGQRQRVAIARTLCLEPKLLMMDEPFASLDALTREDMQNLIMNLWTRLSSTMILVTHNIEEAVFWGQKIMVLSHPPNTKPIIIENPGSGTIGYRNTPDSVLRCKQLRELVEQNGWNGKNMHTNLQEKNNE
jgi:ABC-type nitrate/sulfonate/bicarbonate transport system ATPase subunit